MKKLQHIEKREPAMAIRFDAPPSMNRACTDSISKREYKNVVGSAAICGKHDVVDRVRSYCLHILIFVLTCHAVFGKIKNGYEKNILASKESLKVLRESLLEDRSMTPAGRRRVQSTIATFVNHVSYYDLTESLLIQFKTIAPQLYAEIDTIRDRLRRPVNVYIKFLPLNGRDVKAEGATYMNQSEYHSDACRSEYGEFTVSVKVWIVPRALAVLAHELGHVKYQVPHAASYFEFYKKHYDNKSTQSSIGHDTDDLSGKSAIQFAKTFQKNHAGFLKLTNSKTQNPLAVLARLKKNRSKNAEVF